MYFAVLYSNIMQKYNFINITQQTSVTVRVPSNRSTRESAPDPLFCLLKGLALWERPHPTPQLLFCTVMNNNQCILIRKRKWPRSGSCYVRVKLLACNKLYLSTRMATPDGKKNRQASYSTVLYGTIN